MLVIIWNTCLALTIGAALIRGGRDERWAAACFLLFDAAALLHQRTHWRHDVYSLLLDLSLFGFLLWLSLRTSRWWPLYACAAQLGVVVAWAADEVSVTPSSLGYRTTSAVWSYVVLGSLLAGTLLESKRVAEDRETAMR